MRRKGSQIHTLDANGTPNAKAAGRAARAIAYAALRLRCVPLVTT